MIRRLLSICDGVEISTGRKAGWSIRQIAATIDRASSIVSREIRCNSGTTSGYRAVTADVRAGRRGTRAQIRKIDAGPVLRQRVLADLMAGRSPRRLVGRLRAEASDSTLPVAKGSPHGQGRTVSHEAVYTWL